LLAIGIPPAAAYTTLLPYSYFWYSEKKLVGISRQIIHGELEVDAL